MRVVHVITRLIVGGAQENTAASVLGLARRFGTDTSLICGPQTGPEGSLARAFAAEPSRLVVLPGLVRRPDPWNDPAALARLTAHFARLRPDIVHTHSGKAGILGRCAARLARVPVVVHTIHGPSFGPFQGPAANLFCRAAERFAGRLTTHFVSVADAMTRHYLEAGIGRAQDYTRIYSGFELAPFLAAGSDPALRAQLGIAPEDFVVGMMARLFRLKGHDDLLCLAPELARRHPRVKFLLVGDGPWRARLQERAAALGLGRQVIFSGLVEPARIPALAGVMDALVHLSAREGLARALPQAMAAGKPVVAYDCDGASEVCLDNRTGFLIPPGQWPLAGQRLHELAADPALCQRLGAQGRRHVLPLFPVERLIDDLHSLYRRLRP